MPSEPQDKPPRYYAKSGGVWERDPATGHGHIYALEGKSGAAEEIAEALNLTQWLLETGRLTRTPPAKG